MDRGHELGEGDCKSNLVKQLSAEAFLFQAEDDKEALRRDFWLRGRLLGIRDLQDFDGDVEYLVGLDC